MDLSFHGAIAPGLLKSSEQGVFVTLEMLGKIGQWTGEGTFPPSWPSRIPLANDAEELSRQACALGNFR
jgi:hypothetical protein